MTIVRRIVERFWFAPAPAERTAVLRILIGGYALFLLLNRYGMYSRVAAGHSDLFEPVGVARMLDGPLDPAFFESIMAGTIIANVLFLLGLRFLLTGPLFAGLFLWTMCYRNSWSMIYHVDNLLVLHIIVLGLSASANALSLDALLARRHRRAGWGAWPALATGSDWRYGWPVRLICTLTVLAYFLAGFAKVSGELGWSWASGEAMRSQLVRDGLRKELLGDGAPRLVFALYDHPAILTAVAVGTLILELGAPLVLLKQRLGWLWAPAAWVMHWSIFFIMDIKFRYQLSGIAFASFFAVERLASLARTLAARRAPRTIAAARAAP